MYIIYIYIKTQHTHNTRHDGWTQGNLLPSWTIPNHHTLYGYQAIDALNICLLKQQNKDPAEDSTAG